MVDHGSSSRPSVQDRRLAGQAARTATPPSTHGRWIPSPDRPDPVALFEEQALTRIPWLVPVRHGRMAVSPLTYFRGAALPMAADLATTPNSGIIVQACGDAHLSNFGLFASPERDLVFDINDFDETLPGPFEWDVKRLAASLSLAARYLGFSAHDGRHAARLAVHEYRHRIHQYSTMRSIEVYYSRLDAGGILDYVHKRAHPYLERVDPIGSPSRRPPRAAEADGDRCGWTPPHRRSSTRHQPPARDDPPAGRDRP